MLPKRDQEEPGLLKWPGNRGLREWSLTALDIQEGLSSASLAHCLLAFLFSVCSTGNGWQ